MSDNILSAVLTFSLMVGGTAAIGTEMLDGHHAAATPTKVLTLAPVTVIGHRAPAVVEMVTLAPVTIIGHRKAWTEAAVANDAAAPKVQ